ncbi:MAG: FmdE family protein [Syntrophaceae bacterium]
MDYSEIVGFHGYECSGLAIGYRMAYDAMKALHVERFSDEELVAIVESYQTQNLLIFKPLISGHISRKY